MLDGEGDLGSPPPLAFSPKSCGDYPPEGRDNPLGTCDFHLEFFPSRTGVVDGPRQVRGGREWDGPHVGRFLALSVGRWVKPKPTVPSMRQSLGELRTVPISPNVVSSGPFPFPRTW